MLYGMLWPLDLCNNKPFLPFSASATAGLGGRYQTCFQSTQNKNTTNDAIASRTSRYLDLTHAGANSIFGSIVNANTANAEFKSTYSDNGIYMIWTDYD